MNAVSAAQEHQNRPVPRPKRKSGGKVKRMPREVRERQMLDAAVEVFARRGYSAASMDEIAELAGGRPSRWSTSTSTPRRTSSARASGARPKR
ncbi:hypothetical protein GCM10020000_43930 [Streptomyces olivoverticillatus]